MQDTPTPPSPRPSPAHWVFASLPFPATLVDERGIIVDVNQAFLDFARHLGHSVDRRKRIGHPVAEFAGTAESRERLEEFVRQVLTSGEDADLDWESLEESGRSIAVIIRARVLRDGEGQITGALLLREDISAEKRLEQRRQIIFQVREEVWKMRSSKDIQQVLQTVRDALRRLQVPFRECGVNLVVQETEETTVWFNSMTADGRWTSAGVGARGTRIILDIWRRGEIAYRRDLDREDVHNESRHIDSDLEHHIRSVVDIPFSHGTLAVNNTRPDAFSDEDLEILQEMAQVLSEGFIRLQDFRTLEQRNRELENQIAERQRTEETLRSIVESAPDFILTLDLEGRILYTNRTGDGLSLAEVIGKSVHTLFLEEDHSLFDKALTEAIASGKTTRCEIRAGGLTPETGWFECRLGPIMRDGQVEELTLIAQDITARKQAEQILLQAREELETQVERRTADLQREIAERQRREAQEHVLQQIRESIWGMTRSDDMESVLVALRESLKALGVPFHECGINTVIPETDPPTVHTHTIGHREWKHVNRSERNIIVQIWRSGQIAYRRDLHKEDAFGERFILESNFAHKVRSVLDVPFSYGTLAVNSIEPEAFSQNDIALLQEMARVLSDTFKRIEDMRLLEQRNQELETEVAERQRVEQQVRRSLTDKEVLLQEIHHRVKNNLQVVSSLLDLQARHTGDPQVLEMFRDSRDRIRSMALVHEQLYLSQDLSRIDLRVYIQTLVTDLFHSYSTQTGRIACDIRIDDLGLGIDAAIPCGLIINELVSNALKYAFPDERQGRLIVELRKIEDETISLVVADDGVGFPEDFDLGKSNTLGLKLVQSLVRQLQGRVELVRDGGARFSITFTPPHYPTAH